MNKNVFITGSSGGLGLPVVKELLEKECQVTTLVHSDSSEQRLREVFSTYSKVQLKIVKGNVLKEDDIVNALNRMESLDALVHLAGGFIGAKNISDSSADDFQSIMALNTTSSFLLLRHVLPKLEKRGGGSIVMIGAKPALYPNGQNAVYAASKAALTNLVLSAAEEGRSKNVRANVIVPAVIDTPENRKWAEESTPTEKWTSPSAIARTISWLISGEGSGVTGTILPMFNKIKTY